MARPRARPRGGPCCPPGPRRRRPRRCAGSQASASARNKVELSQSHYRVNQHNAIGRAGAQVPPTTPAGDQPMLPCHWLLEGADRQSAGITVALTASGKPSPGLAVDTTAGGSGCAGCAGSSWVWHTINVIKAIPKH